MKEITLKILKKDILNTNYYDHDDCAITRAIHRAGYPHLHDGGLYIRDSSKNIVSTINKLLIDKVVKMYEYNKCSIFEDSIPPEDFEATITLNIN